MKVLFIAALLASSAAQAGRTWTVEPAQVLVSVDAAPFSAFSHGLTGSITELDDGLSRIELHLPFGTVTTGNAREDARVSRQGQAVFEGVARTGSNPQRFVGTLTFHGVSRPTQIELSVSRTSAMVYGHTVLMLHLRDFGFDLPRDNARVEVTVGFRERGVLADRR